MNTVRKIQLSVAIYFGGVALMGLISLAALILMELNLI
jgi:hypothetical protein